ncbi:MAG: hypothetical protein JSS97_20005 [Actinobacteria bacterium]|nr:hypothetical protein [Actinomycetota bacterium]
MLAVGEGAVLSHGSAVALWGFLRPLSGPIHVTVAAGVPRSPRPGIRVHRSRTLAARDITRRHGIAVTTPARTIDDVRGEIEPYLFRHTLPRPLVNHRVHGHRVDFYWPAQRLAVETDSWDYHRGPVAFEDDHERDLELRVHGITTRRYTGDQLEAAPEAVCADLRRALGLAS